MISTLLLWTTTNCSSPEKEDFESFFYKFSTNTEFQLERIMFPLEYRTWKNPGNPASEIEVREIDRAEWKHEYIFMNEGYLPQLYDNFDGELQDTDERLFRWIGVETGIDVKYFFKRIEGEWHLVKKEDLGD